MKNWIVGMTFLIGLLVFTTMARGATFDFSATDPHDGVPANYDIIAFGAKNEGDNVHIWLQVDGQIETAPESGYTTVYGFSVSDYETSDKTVIILLAWENDGTTISFYGYAANGNAMIELSSSYSVSGGKLDVYIPTYMFDIISDKYDFTAFVGHSPNSDSSPGGVYHVDEATWSSYASSDSSNSSSQNSNSGLPAWILWGIIGAVIAVVIIVVVLVLVLKKPQQPPQYPSYQYPPPPPQEPPQTQ